MNFPGNTDLQSYNRLRLRFYRVWRMTPRELNRSGCVMVTKKKTTAGTVRRRMVTAIGTGCVSALACGGIVLAPDASARPSAPASCSDVRAADADAQDGNYALTVNGAAFTAYCDFDGGEAREYISLQRTGADENFSQYTAGGASPGTSVRTNFTKLRIDPTPVATDPVTFAVDIGDLTFASSTGSLLHSLGTEVSAMPYGVAMSCTGLPDGVANIDLSATPFGNASSFGVGGTAGSGTAQTSANEQIVDLTGGGFCGWEMALPSVFNPFNPSPGNYHLRIAINPAAPLVVLHQAAQTSSGPGRSLPAKVANIEMLVAAGATADACSALTGLRNEVNAQTGKHIGQSDAASLLSATEAVEESIPCTTS